MDGETLHGSMHNRKHVPIYTGPAVCLSVTNIGRHSMSQNCKTSVRDTDQDETVGVNQSRTQPGDSHMWMGRHQRSRSQDSVAGSALGFTERSFHTTASSMHEVQYQNSTAPHLCARPLQGLLPGHHHHQPIPENRGIE